MTIPKDAYNVDCEDGEEVDASTPGTSDPTLPVFPDIYGSIPGESHLNRARDDSFLLVLDLPCFIKKLNLGAEEMEKRYPLDKLEINFFFELIYIRFFICINFNRISRPHS